METALSSFSALVVRVSCGQEELSRAAADRILSLFLSAARAKGRFTLAVSGGSTPRLLFSTLATAPYRDSIRWPAVHIFWADERCVPPDHDESNFRLLRDTLLAHVPVPAGNVHRVHGEIEPARAAEQYEADIRSHFGTQGPPRFDVVLLGVGEDGHTASLFPGSPAVRESVRLASPVYLERPKLDRVTLTFPVLNSAEHVLFLATGAAKAGVVRNILHEQNSRGFPAGLVRPREGSLEWFLDEAAAGGKELL